MWKVLKEHAYKSKAVGFYNYVIYWFKLQIYRIFKRKYIRSRHGILLRMNWKDSIFRSSYYGDSQFDLRHFLSGINIPFVFLDIGANQGVFSLIGGKNPYCRQVLAFEPMAKVYSLLQENIKINKLEKIITPYQLAISDNCGFSHIRFPAHNTGKATINVNNKFENATMEKIQTVDGKFLEKIIPRDGQIFIKIDVEGHEKIVINELMKINQSNRINGIFYEVDTRWINPEKIKNILENQGFQKFMKFGKSITHYDVLALNNYEIVNTHPSR